VRITRKQLRQIILQEMHMHDDDYESELAQFGGSKSGSGCHKIGSRISSAGQGVRAFGDDQTGNMRNVLYDLSDIVEKIGIAIASLGNGGEDSAAMHIQSCPCDIKRVIKNIQRLEK